MLVADSERIERLRDRLPGLGLAGVLVARPEGSVQAGEADVAEIIAKASADTALPDVEIAPDDDATIFYTSGTTGRPKGALGTHRNICTNVLTIAYTVAAGMMRKGGGEMPDLAGLADAPQESILLSVPLFHVTGCHAMLLGSTSFGGKLVMMHKWDPERALELIERERITTFGGVPAMVWQVLESPDFAKRDISSVKSIGYGGAPAPPELVRRIDQLFPGRTPSNGFGMTETSSVVTSNSGADYLRKPDSVGPAVAVCDVKVVGPDDEEVPPGELGELMIKGPNVVPRLLEQARGDRRDVRRRLAAHR